MLYTNLNKKDLYFSPDDLLDKTAVSNYTNLNFSIQKEMQLIREMLKFMRQLIYSLAIIFAEILRIILLYHTLI